MLVEGRMVLERRQRRSAPRRGQAGEEPFVLDEPGQRDSAFRQARWRPRAGVDRVGGEGEVRRPVAASTCSTSTSRSTAARSASPHGRCSRRPASATADPGSLHFSIRSALASRNLRALLRHQVRQPQLRPLRHIYRKRLLEASFELGAVLCRRRYAGRQRDVGERRWPADSATARSKCSRARPAIRRRAPAIPPPQSSLRESFRCAQLSSSSSARVSSARTVATSPIRRSGLSTIDSSPAHAAAVPEECRHVRLRRSREQRRDARRVLLERFAQRPPAGAELANAVASRPAVHPDGPLAQRRRRRAHPRPARISLSTCRNA